MARADDITTSVFGYCGPKEKVLRLVAAPGCLPITAMWNTTLLSRALVAAENAPALQEDHCVSEILTRAGLFFGTEVSVVILPASTSLTVRSSLINNSDHRSAVVVTGGSLVFDEMDALWNLSLRFGIVEFHVTKYGHGRCWVFQRPRAEWQQLPVSNSFRHFVWLTNNCFLYWKQLALRLWWREEHLGIRPLDRACQASSLVSAPSSSNGRSSSSNGRSSSSNGRSSSSSSRPSSSSSRPSSPVNAPSSPVYAPSSPVYAPSSPVYTPSSPVNAPSSPVNAPSSPVYTPSSPVYTPSSPVCAPSSPVCAPSSTTCRPTLAKKKKHKLSHIVSLSVQV